MKELNELVEAAAVGKEFKRDIGVKPETILAIAEAFRALEQRLSMEEKAKKCVHLMLVSAAQDLGLAPEEAGHPFINNAIFNLIQRAEAAEAKLSQLNDEAANERNLRSKFETDCKFLKEKLAEYEKQKPFGFCNEDAKNGDVFSATVWREKEDAESRSCGLELFPLFTLPAPAVNLAEMVPTVCDGEEQEAFEKYARSKGLDLSQHPLHYLFLDGKTNQARSAWRECLVYVRAAILRNIEEAK